eukprot:gene26637-35311_t
MESSEEHVKDAYYIHMAQWHRAALSQGRKEVADYVCHDVTVFFKAVNRTGATSSSSEGKEISLRDMFEGSMNALVALFADNAPAIRAKAVKLADVKEEDTVKDIIRATFQQIWFTAPSVSALITFSGIVDKSKPG